MPVLCDEIKKICNEKITPLELHRAQIQMKSTILMAMESSSSVSEVLARQHLIYNRVIPIKEMVANIESVTQDDILNTAQHIFSANPSYSLVGSFGEYMDYDVLKQNLQVKNG